MNRRPHRPFGLVLAFPLLAPLAACGSKDSPAPVAGESAAPTAAPSQTSPYALASDPGGGVSVSDAKKAGPADDVLVVGRVRDVFPGFASFTLIDVSMKYCGEEHEETPACETPWDYCCIDPGKIAAATLTVSVDEDGQTVALPRIPELRNLDLVVVRGRLDKDSHGDYRLSSTGWFRRSRPSLHPQVKFP